MIRIFVSSVVSIVVTLAFTVQVHAETPVGSATVLNIFDGPLSGEGLFALPWTDTDQTGKKVRHGLLGKIQKQLVFLLPTNGDQTCLSQVSQSQDLKWDTGPIFMANLHPAKCKSLMNRYLLGFLSSEAPAFRNLKAKRAQSGQSIHKLLSQIPERWQKIDDTCSGNRYRIDPTSQTIEFENTVSPTVSLIQFSLKPSNVEQSGALSMYFLQGAWGATFLDASLRFSSAFVLNGKTYLQFHFRDIAECNFGGTLVLEVTPTGPRVTLMDTSGST